VRAVLVLIVLLGWAACLLGAVGLTAYLATTAVRLLRHRHGDDGRNPSPPPRGAVMALVLFAVAMAAIAAGLAGVVLWGRTSGPLSSAVAWAALPMWTALTAAITAVVLWRRRQAPTHELHNS
jgi:hypothetical protein